MRERLDYGLFFAAKVAEDLKAKTRLNRTRAVSLAVQRRDESRFRVPALIHRRARYILLKKCRYP